MSLFGEITLDHSLSYINSLPVILEMTLCL